jgi:hypothetical protein
MRYEDIPKVWLCPDFCRKGSDMKTEFVSYKYNADGSTTYHWCIRLHLLPVPLSLLLSLNLSNVSSPLSAEIP